MTQSMQDTPNAEFARRFKTFIDDANGFLPTSQPAAVSISLNEAAARFHAWVWAQGAPSHEALKDKRAEATAYFLDQCKTMFEAHYDDYVGNYDRFVEQGKQG